MVFIIYGFWKGVYLILYSEKNEVDLKGLYLLFFWGGSY